MAARALRVRIAAGRGRSWTELPAPRRTRHALVKEVLPASQLEDAPNCRAVRVAVETKATPKLADELIDRNEHLSGHGPPRTREMPRSTGASTATLLSACGLRNVAFVRSVRPKRTRRHRGRTPGPPAPAFPRADSSCSTKSRLGAGGQSVSCRPGCASSIPTGMSTRARRRAVLAVRTRD